MPRERLPTVDTPVEPWARRPDWASGRVKDESDSPSAGVGQALGWMFAFFWFGGLLLFALILHAPDARQATANTRFADMTLGLFALAGLLPLALVLHRSRHRGRYRSCVFAMSSVPGTIGGRLEGTIEIPAGLERGTRLRASLTCKLSSTDADFPDQLLWEVPALDVGVFGTSPTRVPVSFEIPFECSASHPDGIRGGVYWRLGLTGLDGAPGLDAGFVVPVFLTADSRRPEEGGPSALTPRPVMAEARAEVPSPGVLRLRYHYGPLAKFFCLVLPFALPVALVFLPSDPGQGALGTVRTIALFATPLVIAFALLTHFTEVMGAEIAGGSLVLSRGYRGWGGSRHLALADLRRIDLDSGVNNYKQVVARTRQGDKVAVSRWVTVMEAHWIADEVRGAIRAAGGALDE